MSSERPYEERPAARPVEPASPEPQLAKKNISENDSEQAEENQEAEIKNGKSGFLGATFVIGIFLVILIIAFANYSGGSGNGQTSKGNGQSTDPIYQVQVVLDGKYSYDQIKLITNSVIAAYGLPENDDSANRIWSAVLSVTDASSVPPMEVMKCAQIPSNSSLTFPGMAGICFTNLLADF